MILGRFLHSLFARAGFLLVAIFAFSSQVFAAKSATVLTDSTPVLQSADSNAFVLEIIPQGTLIKTADFPSGGFFKVMTPSGKIGWVIESSLRTVSSSSRSDGEATSYGSGNRGRQIAKPKSRANSAFGMQLFGGIDFLNVRDFQSSALGQAETKSAADYGIEVLYRFTPRIKGLFHFEHLTKAVALTVDNPVSTFDLSVSSTPVMIGGTYSITRSPTFDFGLSGLAGIAMGSRFSSVLSSAAPPAETSFGGTPLTVIGRADCAFRARGPMWFGGSVGYRLLNVAAAPPKVIGTGSYVFQAADGSYPSYGIGMSGIFVNLSATYWF